MTLSFITRRVKIPSLLKQHYFRIIMEGIFITGEKKNGRKNQQPAILLLIKFVDRLHIILLLS